MTHLTPMTPSDAQLAILNHRLISERYFFPRRAPVTTPLFVEAEGARLACYLAAPHPDAQTLVHFHGNGEVVADYIPDYVEALTSAGVNVFLAEYRGYGRSTGEPALGAMLADVEPIFRALGCAPERVIAYGRSVGSIYAIELAARYPQLGGLVLESGISDVLERILLRVQPSDLGVSLATLTAAVSAHLDHAAKLSRYKGPLLVMHAADDDLVDATHAQRNWAAAGCAPEQKTLCMFKRGGHNGLMSENWPAYIQALRQFIARCGASA
jgi:alpha-beta hydrolase superfamily lysophospholipase